MCEIWYQHQPSQGKSSGTGAEIFKNILSSGHIQVRQALRRKRVAGTHHPHCLQQTTLCHTELQWGCHKTLWRVSSFFFFHFCSLQLNMIICRTLQGTSFYGGEKERVRLSRGKEWNCEKTVKESPYNTIKIKLYGLLWFDNSHHFKRRIFGVILNFFFFFKLSIIGVL